jgi:hypothetical protein
VDRGSSTSMNFMMTIGYKWFLEIGLIVTLGFSHSTAFGGPRTGLIRGRIVNMTADERIVPAHSLTLLSFEGEEATELPKRTTQTNARGEFSFDGLGLSPDRTYILTTEYQTAQYSEGPLTFSDDETEKEVDLTVYDTTSAATHIFVDQHHILVEPVADSLLIQEFMRLLNVGRKTYIGTFSDSFGVRVTLDVTLPPGASTPKLSGGFSEASFTFHHGGFIDSRPLQPGSRGLLFTYALPFTARSIEYRTILHYEHHALDLFLASRSIHVSSPDLAQVGIVGGEDARYIRYSGQNLEAGHQVTVSLKKTAPVSRSSLWLLVGALLAALFITIRLVVARTQRGKGAPPRNDRRNSIQRKEALIQAIADLDERYERGDIDSDSYHRERKRFKSGLSQLLRRTEE